MGFEKNSNLYGIGRSGRYLGVMLGAGAILGIGVLAGCGGQSEEPAPTTTAAENTTVITNTVEVPVASNSAPKVVVKSPSVTTKTTTNTTAAKAPAAPARVAAAPQKPVAAAPAIVAAPAPKTVPSNASLVVQGQVVAVSKPLKAGEYEGKGYLTYTKYKVLSVEKGSYTKPLIVAAHWGMKDGKPGPASGYKIGQKVRLELEPLDKYFEKNAEVSALSGADEVSDVDSVPYWAG